MEDETRKIVTKGLLQSPELYEYIMDTTLYLREQHPLKELRIATANHPRSTMSTAQTQVSFEVKAQLMAEINKVVFPPKGILKSEELFEYIQETSVLPREPEPLQELRKLTKSHPMYIMATTPDSGQLLSMLLKLTNARRTIEVGVFTGYSLLLTALTIPDDGKIIAIDPNLEDYKFGLPVIQKAGVEHKIDFINSEALPVLDKLLENPENEGSFDFAFVDADKINYLNYHERLLKLVKVGGIIVYDNTLWFGTVVEPDEEIHSLLKEGKPHTIKLTKALVADPRIEIAHVSVGDGLIICRRLY